MTGLTLRVQESVVTFLQLLFDLALTCNESYEAARRKRLYRQVCSIRSALTKTGATGDVSCSFKECVIMSFF